MLRPGQARAQAALAERQARVPQELRQAVPGARAVLAERQVVPVARAVRVLPREVQELLPAREPRVVQERQVLLPALQRELVPLPGRRPHLCHLRCERGALQPRRCRLRPQEWPQ